MDSLFARPTLNSIQILMITGDLNLNLSLTQAGYRVIPATCGVEALVKFQTHKIDLVVLDMMILQTDGLSLCQQLHRCADVPIILLTPNRPDAIVHGLEMGADDAITSPVAPMELMARIQALLRRLYRIADIRGASSHHTANKESLVVKDRAYAQYAPPSLVSGSLAIEQF